MKNFLVLNVQIDTKSYLKNYQKRKKRKMSNINDYYQKLSQDLLTYIQNQEYEKALSIIDDELAQPYIPNEHYINLINTKDEIEEKLQEIAYQDEIESLSKLQV